MKTKNIKLLDIIFVILLVAFVVIVFMQKTGKSVEVGNNDIVLAIEADEIETYSVGVPKTGDKVIDKRRNSNIGTVKSVEVNNAIDNPIAEYSGVENGRENDGNFNSLRIFVDAKADVKDDGIYINGFNYLLGDELTFTVGDLQIYAKIKNVEVAQ